MKVNLYFEWFGVVLRDALFFEWLRFTAVWKGIIRLDEFYKSYVTKDWLGICAFQWDEADQYEFHISVTKSSCCRISPKKFRVVQLVKKFCTFIEPKGQLLRSENLIRVNIFLHTLFIWESFSVPSSLRSSNSSLSLKFSYQIIVCIHFMRLRISPSEVSLI